MGGSTAKPEFVSVLADKEVKEGEDVTLQCKTKTKGVTAKWKKNSLRCVADKHIIYQNKRGTEFTLEIRKAEKEDEGKYTVTLENKSGSASCSAMVTLEFKEWRTVEWNPEPMITALQKFTVNEVKELRFLLHGPVGAGKSSIINTIATIFEEHLFINCLAASALTGHSFTTKFEKFPVGTLPFAFYDMMGLEPDNKQGGKLAGAHQDDIIKALKGHIPDDYEFQPETSISEDNSYYISNPTLNDKIHCVISVVAADKVTLMDAGIIQKIKTIRAEASKLGGKLAGAHQDDIIKALKGHIPDDYEDGKPLLLPSLMAIPCLFDGESEDFKGFQMQGIPQLVFMTRVDQACKMTQKDLTKIYRSKKIKEKMEQCSNRLGIPMNCIFPVKNYHDEIKIDKNLNCLMLQGLTQAVYSAHDYVKKSSHKHKAVE